MINPRGSDGLALVQAVAPRAAVRLHQLSNLLGIVVLVMSVAALCLTVAVVSVRREVTAVSPAGNIIPLVQLDGDNEAAVRAQLEAPQLLEVPALPDGER